MLAKWGKLTTNKITFLAYYDFFSFLALLGKRQKMEKNWRMRLLNIVGKVLQASTNVLKSEIVADTMNKLEWNREKR